MMRWGDKLRMRIRFLLHRGREVQRLNEEFNFHLTQQIAENVAAGMNPTDAQDAALRAFGNPTVLHEQSREAWSWNRLELVAHDFRIGIRTLARKPRFALIAMAVIAIGIGANVALFTAVHSILLKPLPFDEPERLVRVYEASSDGKDATNVVAGGIFTAWKDQSRSFSDLALVLTWPEYSLSGTGEQLSEKVHAAQCSWNLFSTLGVRPALGRTFAAHEDDPSSNATVVLSWGLWKRRFGGNPAILDQTIHLDGKAYTVIGVMPSWFAYPAPQTQLWTPVYHERPPELMRSLTAHMFVVVGRLKAGVAETQAIADLSVIERQIHNEHSNDPFIFQTVSVRPLLDDIVGDLKTPLYILFAATICVLLIACLNIANLLVARAATRRKGMAIRVALGGGRLRVLREQLIESLLVSSTGGGIGLLLAYSLIRWLVHTRPDISRIDTTYIDGPVFAFCLGVVLFCAIFTALVASLSSSSRHVLVALQESSRSHSGGQARAKLRKLLVSLEVALTVTLLVGAGLLLKSYERLRSTDPGCITQNVLTMRLPLSDSRYGRPLQRVTFLDALMTRVRALPGVQAAGLGLSIPGEDWLWNNGFTIVEHPPLPRNQKQTATVSYADPGYFAALGIPFLSGGNFSEAKRLEQADQVIVSESFARRYFPGEDPVGKHIVASVSTDNRHYQVAGVVGDTRLLISRPPEPIMYFPMYSGDLNEAALVVRSRQDVTQLALPIQRLVYRLDAELPVSDILTMDQIIGKSTVDMRFNATVLLGFSVLSLVLAGVGLFGVLSYLVNQRTIEIGIRIAFGARRGEVLGLVLRDGLGPAVIGLTLGIAGSIAAAQAIRSMLYQTRPLDPLVFVSVTIGLLLVACVACLIPAWRASRLDPIAALRTE